MSKSFANDIMLAVSCREAGCVLVTANTKAFARIRRFVPFEFVTRGPWAAWAAALNREPALHEGRTRI